MDVPTYVSSFAPRNFPNRVIVTYPPYPRKLEHLLETTSSEVVQAYLITRVGLDLAGNLGPGTQPWQIVRELVEVLNGLKKGTVPDRAEWCLSKVEEALGFASGRFYVKELFNGRSPPIGTFGLIFTTFHRIGSARAQALSVIEGNIQSLGDPSKNS